MRVDLSERVPGVHPAAALAWWRDFREGAHDHGPRVERRILEARAQGATMEDRVRVGPLTVWRERTTAEAVGDEVRFRGENGLSRFEGRYAFAADGDGTRVRLVADVRLKGALAWTERAARPVVEAILRADLRHHARELRRDAASAGARRA